MGLNGDKTGVLEVRAKCGTIEVSATILPTGSSAPAFGVNAPAAMTGTVVSTSGNPSITVNDPSGLITAGNYESVWLAVFWTVGGVLKAFYDVAIADVSTDAGVDSLTLFGDSLNFAWAQHGAVPSGLPTAGTTIGIAVAQVVNDGVDIPAGSSAPHNIRQLIAASSQAGLVKWSADLEGTTERLSAFASPNSFDTWPTSAGQTGNLPVDAWGNTWSSGATVTYLMFYNFGSLPAVMQAGAILA